MTATTGGHLSGQTSPGDDGSGPNGALDSKGGHDFLDHKLAALLLGKDTVTYLRGRRETRRRYPVEKLDGPSRWEAMDSDAPDPGPYAMPDEQAGALLMSAEFHDALAGLRQSYLDRPIMVDLQEPPLNGAPPPMRGA
jgi:hypothetical protein